MAVDKLVITEDPTLARDIHSKALLSVDSDKLARSRSARGRALAAIGARTNLEARVSALETKLDRLTNMIETLVNAAVKAN